MPRSEVESRASSNSSDPEYDSEGVSDELLMVRYQRGDRNAFTSLVRRHKRPVFNFILRQVGDFSVAEDTTQEVFLRVVQKASHFKHEARFSTWLYTIARNLSIDYLRKQSLRRHPSLDQPLKPTEPGRTLGESIEDPHHRSSVERSALSQQVGQCVIEAVELLPIEQKEVFLLREIANLPFKEIAQVTESGENTVKSRMRYALQRLQQALSEFEEYARELK